MREHQRRKDATTTNPTANVAQRQASAPVPLATGNPRFTTQRQLIEDIDSSSRVMQQRSRLQDIGAASPDSPALAATRPDRGGLPDNLRAGIENLSGISMDNVRVHYNSSHPAQLNAHAYAQDSEIHLAPGQEHHLPHEAWHLVQQKQSRVRPTMHTKDGVAVNNDKALEREADTMGSRALGASRSPAPTQLVRRVSGGSAGIAVQCVGGPKFGLKAQGDAEDGDVKEGLGQLKKVMADYKKEVKDAKGQATDDFKGGDKANVGRQTTYSEQLRTTEVTSAGLLGKLPEGFTHADGVISFRGKPVAQVLEGDLAYEKISDGRGEGYSPIYKRHTLDGHSDKEYVSFGGQHLRRKAYRGITPPERTAHGKGEDLKPLNSASIKTPSRGYNFNKSTGKPVKRRWDKKKKRLHQTDLEWLQESAQTPGLTEVPEDKRLQAFVQTRKGVNKAFSATSTPKSITSNHGAEFTDHGNITIDLAEVPTANILHHYRSPDFTEDDISTRLGGSGPKNRLAEESRRANESIRRNRELVLTSIPHGAVTELK